MQINNQAIEHEATLLSNDKHFKLIQNLRTENIF
jgi:predicted nucleic acid-binding protein